MLSNNYEVVIIEAVSHNVEVVSHNNEIVGHTYDSKKL